MGSQTFINSAGAAYYGQAFNQSEIVAGTIYSGEWHGTEAQGFGKYQYPDGSTYTGGVERFKRSGQGTLSLIHI